MGNVYAFPIRMARRQSVIFFVVSSSIMSASPRFICRHLVTPPNNLSIDMMDVNVTGRIVAVFSTPLRK